MLSKIVFGQVIEGTRWNIRPKNDDGGDKSTVSMIFLDVSSFDFCLSKLNFLLEIVQLGKQRVKQLEIQLKSKKLLANTEFIKSYKIQENKIRTCFETIGDSSGILEEVKIKIYLEWKKERKR